MNNKIYQYQTKNLGEMIAIMSFLKTIGFSIDSFGGDEINSKAKQWFKNYPVLVINSYINNLGGRATKLADEDISFEEIFAIFGSPRVTVKLNDSYSAEVTKESVKVGCQTFPISIIGDLVAARDRVLN